MEMSRTAGAYILTPDAQTMFDLYRDLYEQTHGLMTPLVGQMLVDAGYDAQYSLQQKRQLLPPMKWQEVMEYQFPNLYIKTPTLIDVGAMGKGYLVDIVASVIEDFGVTGYCVDAGGDMRHRGSQSIRVGLEHPQDFSQVIGVVELGNQSLCGSAGNRRAWGLWNHIMNPQTLSSVTDIIAVWVIADTTILADAIATCLFLVGADTIKGHRFEYLLVRADLSMEKSEGFQLQQ